MIEYKSIMVIDGSQMDSVVKFMNEEGYIFVNAVPLGKGAVYLLARQVMPQNTTTPTSPIITG